MTAGFAGNPLAALGLPLMADLEARTFDQARSALHSVVSGRREQVALVRRRRAALDKAETILAQKLETWRERQEAAATARKRREQTDAAFDTAGRALVEALGNPLRRS